MKAKIKHKEGQGRFKPFTLKIKVKTLAEAQNLRAFHAGIRQDLLNQLLEGAIYHRDCATTTGMENVITVIGVALAEELDAQGLSQ